MTEKEIKNLVDKEIKNLKWLNLEHITEEDFDDIINDLKVNFEEEYHRDDFDAWYDGVAYFKILEYLRAKYQCREDKIKNIIDFTSEIIIGGKTNKSLTESITELSKEVLDIKSRIEFEGDKITLSCVIDILDNFCKITNLYENKK